MLSQAPVEAASVSTDAVTVLGAGLGAAEVAPQGALSSGDGAEARFGNKGGQGVLRWLGVVLTAVILAFRGLAPISAR